MKGLLAGLAVCLLAALLLVLVDGMGRENSHPAASWLQDAQWACTTIASDRWLQFHTRARGTKWQFTLNKRRWKDTHCQVRWLRLHSGGKFPVKATILSSVSTSFQGAVAPREQSALLGSFVPRTSLFLLKGDRQIPVSSADLARSRDLAIPGEQTKSSF